MDTIREAVRRRIDGSMAWLIVGIALISAGLKPSFLQRFMPSDSETIVVILFEIVGALVVGYSAVRILGTHCPSCRTRYGFLAFPLGLFRGDQWTFCPFCGYPVDRTTVLPFQLGVTLEKAISTLGEPVRNCVDGGGRIFLWRGTPGDYTYNLRAKVDHNGLISDASIVWTHPEVEI